MDPPLIIYHMNSYGKNCGLLCDPRIFEFTILHFMTFFLPNTYFCQKKITKKPMLKVI